MHYPYAISLHRTHMIQYIAGYKYQLFEVSFGNNFDQNLAFGADVAMKCLDWCWKIKGSNSFWSLSHLLPHQRFENKRERKGGKDGQARPGKPLSPAYWVGHIWIGVYTNQGGSLLMLQAYHRASCYFWGLIKTRVPLHLSLAKEPQ